MITAVDIDAAMLTVATNYFGLTCDDKLKVVIDDGLAFLEKAANAGRYTDNWPEGVSNCHNVVVVR